MADNVKNVVAGIKAGLTQKSASKKDEVLVMQAMLNDRKYTVDVYGKDGVQGQYNPSKDFRGVVSDIMSSAAHMQKAEAEKIVDGYDFKRNHAESMVSVAKEFINTYMETGRKMKLGGRKTSDVSIVKKDFAAGMRRYPTQIGVTDDGKPINGSSEVWVGAYSGIKASSPCPPCIR